MYWLKYINIKWEKKGKENRKKESKKNKENPKEKKDIQGCEKDNFLVTPCA